MYVLPTLTPDEILLYSRKSRSDDPNIPVEEVLEKHEKLLDEWVERTLPGLGPIPESNRYREVVSGETISSRPKISELLLRIESPRIKAVICVEPQRLSRGDLEDIGRLVKILRYTKTIVICAGPPQYYYDLRDDHDRDSFERELKRGNEYLEYTKRILRRGVEQSVESGNYLGHRPPYGYDKVTIKDGRKKHHTLVPNPDQAPVVKWIFEMYKDGISSYRIAEQLNEMGIKTAQGKEWLPVTLGKMRRNIHYIGKVTWNHRETIKIVENGEVKKSRPINHEYMVYEGKHEPLIDMDTWNAVQEIVSKVPPKPSRKEHTNEFAGIIRCKACGKSLYLQTHKRKGKHTAEPRLTCNNQSKCQCASCTISEMRAEIVTVLKDSIADFELRIEQDASDSIALHAQLVANMEKKLKELEALEVSQWEKYTMEGMPKHIFDKLNAKVTKDKEDLEEALQVARESIPERIDYEQKKVMFSDALKLLQDPDAPILQKNLLLKSCFDHVEYFRKKKDPRYGRRWGTPNPIELDVHLNV